MLAAQNSYAMFYLRLNTSKMNDIVQKFILRDFKAVECQENSPQVMPCSVNIILKASYYQPSLKWVFTNLLLRCWRLTLTITKYLYIGKTFYETLLGLTIFFSFGF